jgi:TolB-like protein/Tfp pilus assembly protein PilF
MKRCPECRRDYFDETMLFCLDDGSRLLEGPLSMEPPTAVMVDPSGEAETRAFTDRPALVERSSFNQRSLAIGLVGVLVVTLLGVGSFWYYGRIETGRIDSIAVMPFVNATGNPDLEYLSDGLTETLITSLSQLRELVVKPRSTVFSYKGKETNAPAMGRELNVQTILTGKVAERAGEVGLYVELVDTSTDRVVWSKDYKRPLSSLIALQSEVAREVSSELRTRLSGADVRQVTKNYTNSPEAYQLYLKGRFHWNKRTKDNLYKAIDYFRQAVDLDPNYALAYAALADAYTILGGYDFVLSRRELGEKARENALRALALDESLPQAHISLGLVLRTLDHNFSEAESRIRRGLELDPTNADGCNYLAYIQLASGRMSEAEANYKRAVELEPASPNHIRNYGAFLMYTRRYDESLVQLRKAIDLEPNFVLALLTMSNVYQMQGKYADAVEVYARAREISGDPAVASIMRQSFATGGWKGFISGLNEKKWFEEFRPRYIRAGQLVSIGERESAVAELERAYEERDGFIILLNIDPRLDPLRGEPRFKELVKRVGLPQ